MRAPKSVEPPRLATWLMARFSLVLDNGPLAGDLIEAFKQGRSPGWYWRQVSAAILIGLAARLPRHLGFFIYALASGLLVSAAWFFVIGNPRGASVFPKVFAMYATGYTIEWPWSLVYQVAFFDVFQAGAVVVLLVVHLAVCRRLWRRHLFGTLLLVGIVVTILNLPLPLLFVVFLNHIPWWVLTSTAPVVALFFGRWKATADSRPLPVSG